MVDFRAMKRQARHRLRHDGGWAMGAFALLVALHLLLSHTGLAGTVPDVARSHGHALATEAGAYGQIGADRQDGSCPVNVAKAPLPGGVPTLMAAQPARLLALAPPAPSRRAVARPRNGPTRQALLQRFTL